MDTTTTSPPTRPRMGTRGRAALAALLIGEAMNLLDATITTVAAPVIRAGLHGSSADIPWVTAAYTLPFAVLLIPGGRLGDAYGRRRVFRIGMTGFVLASLACALAGSMPVLIGLRAAQGACAALVIPQTIGLIKAMFAGELMSRALGMIGPVMGLSAVAGPVLGGVLTAADVGGSSWRSVFCVVVPFGILVLALSPAITEDRAAQRPRLDVTGTVLAALGTVALVYPLVQGQELGWPGWVWPCFAAGVLLLAGLVRHVRTAQARGRAALVEPTLFADRPFRAGLAVSLLFFAVTTGLLLVVQVRLQLGGHASPLVAGLTLVPWSVGLGGASLLAGRRLLPRYGDRVLFAGMAVLLLGVGAAAAGYALSPAGPYPWLVLVPLAVCGTGAGLVSVPFFTAALHRVGPGEAGSAAGLLNAVQQLGGTVGIAGLGTIALADPVHGPVVAFAVSALLVLGAAAAVLLVPLSRRAG